MPANIQAILIAIVIGIVAGWLASFIVGGGSLIRYAIWGLIGSLVGPILLQMLNINLGIGNPLISQIIVSAIGAVVVVLLARLIAS